MGAAFIALPVFSLSLCPPLSLPPSLCLSLFGGAADAEIKRLEH